MGPSSVIGAFDTTDTSTKLFKGNVITLTPKLSGCTLWSHCSQRQLCSNFIWG